MNSNEMMNVLVLGASGAGKSTLINAISGSEIVTGGGESITDKIDVYASDTWPLRLIDTKGFEYSFLAQRKTIKQVKEFTGKQIKNSDNNDSEARGIDAVWYCVEGTSKKSFVHNIELMNKAIKGWKNVPVFAVITKSYSEPDIAENIQAIAQSFAKMKKINLQKIIPVVAEEYRIDDTMSVAPMGVDELCEATLNCVDTAKSINEENRRRMALEQKRFTANALIAGATTSAAIVGAVPISFADAAILVPLETGLVKGIFKIYKVDYSVDLIAAIIGSAAITNVAKAAITPLKTLPIAGSVINGTVAGVIVLALGEAEIATAEAIHTGRIDPGKIEEVVEFTEKKLQDSKIAGDAIRFLQDNVRDIKGKSSKEIVAMFLNNFKDDLI